MWKKVKINFLPVVKVMFWFGCAARNWNPGSYLILRAYIVLGNVAMVTAKKHDSGYRVDFCKTK